MSVTDNVTTTIKVLRSRIVGGCCVGEGTRREVDELHRDIKVLVGLDVVAILRACEDRGNHVVG
jgi:hypothetical protein